MDMVRESVEFYISQDLVILGLARFQSRSLVTSLLRMTRPEKTALPQKSCHSERSEESAIPFYVRHRFIAFLFLTSLLVLTTSLSAAQNTHTTVRRHKVAEPDSGLAEAESAIEKKDYLAAEGLLQKVVTKQPDHYQAWFDLGFVYNALGKTDDSIAAYRKSVETKPDVFESNLNLGLMLVRAGQPGAEQYLRAATKLKPTSNVEEGSFRAWLSLGNVLAPTKPDDAIEAFHQASVLKPKDAEPHLSAGAVLEKQNRYTDAVEQYKAALALDPQAADALTGLANIYMRGHRFGEAEDVLRKLLALRPNDHSAQAQLGRMLASDGRNDEAIAELQNALHSSPDDPELQRDLADLHLQAKHYAEAEALYKSLVVRTPNDPVVHNSYGQCLLRQNKLEEAWQQFFAAVQMKPDFGEAYGNLAIVANQAKNFPAVLQALDQRAKFLPEVPATYFLRATAYDHLRNVKLASENYHRFLDVANGQYPDQEWQARHRLIAIEPKR